MASITNPFKKQTVAPLVDQLDAKGGELEARAHDKTEEAAQLAKLAAEAAHEAEVAQTQAHAVDRAYAILADAGVTL
ncbi:hypothetical protein QDW23_gp63 [Microbacterium phage Stromboli]|uniref:hypothetical protein n=1 Tax=Microbacterium phage Stromboli TaxID=2713263 RepID=UPI0014171BD2|nr:hypothetical protein QDW23_gp63 [Microbacterium phage Stromboli]QIN93722.1 hypothetical protein SEA_STROMBOLI_63 [Microbacterium phage Stromboli]